MRTLKKILVGVVLPFVLFSTIAVPAFTNAQTATLTAPGIPAGPSASPTCGSGYMLESRSDAYNADYFPTGSPAGAQYACVSQTGDAATGNVTIGQYFDANGNDLNGSGTVGVASGVSQGCTGSNCKSAQTSCSILAPGSWFQNCIWFPLMSWLGSWFLTLGGIALRLVGALFDILVQQVIIGFGQMLQTMGIISAINNGWTIFRDIANIAIIGMFVFIAIGIILGLKEYGQKKLVANVIIVAVLLNFSLLFTEMIIDFSNFTAYQFYSASSQVSGSQNVNVSNFDIAQAFLTPMGITNVWNDTQTVTDAAGQASGNSATAAFFYGLVGGIMLLGVAAVLAYGCYVIALRGILFIILMVTAAIAFASYLVPKFSQSAYGWKGWWEALINASLFAPLLMIFLLISLGILKTTQNFTANSNLHSFINNPQSASLGGTNAWGAIFTYIIVLGLLYASFKISSKIASSVPGSDLPMKLGRMAVSAGTTAVTGIPGLAAGGVSSLMGRSGYQRAAELTGQSQSMSVRAGLHEKNYEAALRRGDEAQARKHETEMIDARREAQRLAQKAERVSQRKPVAAYGKRIAKRAQTAAAVAKRAMPSAKQIAAARAEARTGYSDAEFEKMKQDATAARGQAQAAQSNVSAANAQKTAADQRLAEAQKVRDEAIIAATRSGAASTDREYQDRHAEIGTATNTATAITDEIKRAFEGQLGNVKAELRDGITESIKNIGPASTPDELQKLRAEITNAAAEDKRSEVQTELQHSGQKESDLRHELDRIKNAQEAILRKAAGNSYGETSGSDVKQAQSVVTDMQSLANLAQRDAQYAQQESRRLNTAADTAEEAVRKRQVAVTTAAQAAATETEAAIREATAKVIEGIGERGTGLFPNLFSDTDTGKKMAGDYRSSHSGRDRLLRDLQQLRAQQEADEGSNT